MGFIGRLARIAAALTLCTLHMFFACAHAQTPPREAAFDHSRTGFVLKDVHATLRCEQCHVDGIFKNTPKNCGGCHAIGSRVGATPKPVNHVQTAAPCDTCHSTQTSFLVRSFKHVGISGGCASCHNGQSLGVTSKPANHFPTLLPCEFCHTSTNTFLSWKMDHTGITSRCVACHGGQFAGIVGKPVTHVATSAPCETCHAGTATFLGARFDHAGTTPPVAGICNSCHLGQLSGVVTQPPVHIMTAGAQCDTCHTAANTGGYTSFLGGYYNHATTILPAAAGNCSSCHTGQFPGVLGKPAFHIATTAQCDTCHTATNTANYTTFFGAIYNHAAVTPGSCGNCHNGVVALGKPAMHVPTSAACDSCHVNTANYTTWLGAIYVHSPNPPTPGSCATCHNGVTARGKPGWHIPTTASCEVCHTAANTSNYTTFLGATIIDHTAIPPGNCQSCHNGVSAQGLSAGHIPTGAMSCDGCHQKYNGSSVLTFAPGVMNHLVTATLRCDACHNGSYTTQGTSGAQAKAANHIPTAITAGLDCDTCHNMTLSTSIAAMSWLTERMNHNSAQGGGPVYCVNCHLTGTTYVGRMQKMSHNGASTAKDCSSASCHRPIGRAGTAYSLWN